MEVRYLAEVLSSDGKNKFHVSEIASVEATRSFNNDGILSLTLPTVYGINDFSWNDQIVLWRTLDGRNPHKFGDTHWFVRSMSRRQAQNVLVIEAVDSFAILSHRIVAYTAQTPYADKTMEEFMIAMPDDRLRLDNMMRAYMRENYGSLALDEERFVPQIIIGDDENLAPYGEKKAAWTEISSVLKDLANQSAAQGYSLYYDLVPTSDGNMEFRIWNDVRSSDRGSTSKAPLILSDKDRSIAEAEEIVDYGEIGTACYALGYDSGSSLVYELVLNREVIGRNPYSRVEFTITHSDSDSYAYLDRMAEGALYGKRGKRFVKARVVDGTTAYYGIDYFYGDKVVAEIFGNRYDCMIDAVKASWSNGRENIDIRLSSEEFVA